MPFLNPEGLACGLVRELEGFHERAPVPLKAVHVALDVVDFLAEVTVRQEYVNVEESPIEAAYLFPVEPGAGVVHFEAEVDGRKIEARLKERQEAKKEYDEAVEQNKTAFLLEETREDLFQIRVGHLKPGAGAKIVLRYVMELPAEEGHVRLAVPSTIAPRYTPSEYITSYADQTGDAARKVAGLKYQLETPAPMTVELNVKSSCEIKKVESPSHSLKQSDPEKQGEFYKMQCSLEGTVTDMDRDFVALIRTEDIHKPRVLLEESKDTFATLVSLVPSFNLKEQQAELVFLVDRSGSMNGPGIEQAKKALQLFLHSLPADCLFNIYSFGSRFSSLFEESVKYDDDTLAQAKTHVAAMKADYGGTEIFRPLEKILKDSPKEGYVRQVFVLTDGSVFNDKEVISMVRKSEGSRVFALGLGDGCSKNLVKGIARAGDGTAAFAVDGEDLRPRVMTQLKNALQPAMKEVRVEWLGSTADKTCGGKAKLKEVVLEAGEGSSGLLLGQCPVVLPSVYDGSRLLAFRIFGKDEPRPKSARIVAVTPDGELTAEMAVESTLGDDSRIVHQLAAKRRMGDLEEIKTDLTPAERPLAIHDVSSDEGDEEEDLGPRPEWNPKDEAKRREMEAWRAKHTQRKQRRWERKRAKYEKRLEERKREREAEAERVRPAMDRIKAAMVEYGIKYGLASSATSFVAVDPKDPNGKEYAEMQTREVPHMLASGYGGVMARCGAPVMACSAPMMRGAPMPASAHYAAAPAAMAMPLAGAPAPPGRGVMMMDAGMPMMRMKKSNMRVNAAPEALCDDLLGGGVDESLEHMEEEENSGDDLADLIDLQGSSGVFRWGKTFEKLLGLTESEAVSRKPSSCGDNSAWLTLLAVAVLECRMADKKDLWELVVEKAVKFAEKSLGNKEAVAKVKQEAKEVVDKK